MHLVNHLAYLDAGTGSLIIQSVVGIAAGVAVFGRRSIGNIKRKVVSAFNRSDKTTEK